MNDLRKGSASLPDDILGLIIQKLPWRKRVLVERVSKRWERVALTHSWTDVKLFSTLDKMDGLNHHPSWWAPLLSRVGRYLNALQLEGYSLEDSGLVLAEVLSGCSNVRHLSVSWGWLDAPALNYIRSVCSATLKSFHIMDHLYSFNSPSVALSAISEALCDFSALEFLVIHVGAEHRGSFNNGMHLSASLTNLRRVTFYSRTHETTREFLRSENIGMLPSLCSFRLVHWGPMADFSFLQRFPQLEHLQLSICDQNAGSLIEALPCLSASLKALEMYKASADHLDFTTLGRLISAISTSLPQLEHLRLEGELIAGHTTIGTNSSKRAVTGWKRLSMPRTSFAAMPNLRSLSFNASFTLDGHYTDLESWTWIEDVAHRLEYLQLRKPPPLTTLCNIVRNGKNLRSLDLCSLKLDAGDRRALAGAVAAYNENGKSNSGSKEAPLLIVNSKRNRTRVQERNFFARRSTRLQFVHLGILKSRVLEKYMSGSLSEGEPQFVQGLI